MQIESHTPVVFGKLPDRGDFVRFNAGGTAVGAMKKWIQKGLQVGANISSFDAAYGSAPSFHFWFDGGASTGVLAGTIYPSHDRVGREHPFLVASEINRDNFHGVQLPQVPIRWSGYLDHAEKLAQSAVDGGLSLNRLVSRLKLAADGVSDREPPQKTYRQFLEETTLDRLCERLWNGFDDPRKYLLFQNLTAILLPLQEGVPPRFPLALRFPLGVDRRDRIYEAALWLDLSFRFLQAAEIQPTFFWTAASPDGRAAPFLLLTLRPPSAGCFAYLFADMRDDQLCILDRNGMEDAADAARSLPRLLSQRLESGTLRLSQLIQGLTRQQLRYEDETGTT